MYDPHRLRLLRELRYRGTLAAVADALGYNPSTISQQLRLLEREVGTPLLEPHGRRVRLTAAAEVLTDHADRILQELESAEAAIQSLQTAVTGTVRVAVFQTAAHRIVPPAVVHLSRHFPLLSTAFVQADSREVLSALLAGEVDLVLAERYPGEPVEKTKGVSSEFQIMDPLWIAVPAKDSHTELADLAESNWAVEPSGAPARAHAVARCRAAGYEPRIAYESSDVLFLRHLVEQGLAVTFLPSMAIDKTSRLRLVSTGESRTIEAALRAGSGGNPAIRAVSEALYEALLVVAAQAAAVTVRLVDEQGGN